MSRLSNVFFRGHKALLGAFLAVNGVTFIDGAMTGYQQQPLCDASQINKPGRPYALKGVFHQIAGFGLAIGLSPNEAERAVGAMRDAILYSGIAGEVLGGFGGIAAHQIIAPRHCYESAID